MVRSDNFSDIIAMLVATDKQGVVTFMRSEGINVSQSDDVKVITKTLFMSLVKSEVFKTNFIRWAESRYKSESNYSGESYASGGFDPMATQGSGQEFDAMSSQQGANLKEDGFANASGEFDTMSTQSGGFSTTETQFANVGGLFENDNPYDATAPVGTTGTGLGNALRGVNWNDLITNGVGIWQTDQKGKQQQKLIDAQVKAKQLELQALVEQGKLSTTQMERELALLNAQKNAPKSTVYLWIIGGVVLLGALGTTIYFATRKK